jgi:hypothetical protein
MVFLLAGLFLAVAVAAGALLDRAGPCHDDVPVAPPR